jgi:hypothetical protein
VDERRWEVYATQEDGSEKRYVYTRAASEPPPRRNDIIQVDPLTRIVVLDVHPKEPGPGEVGVIRGRPPRDRR